jgi:hypothetical protein
MPIVYEKAVAEDLELGYGTVTRTNPAGGTMVGSKIGMHTFISDLPAYANNTAAKAGGLVAGQSYRTGGDPDLICVVH